MALLVAVAMAPSAPRAVTAAGTATTNLPFGAGRAFKDRANRLRPSERSRGFTWGYGGGDPIAPSREPKLLVKQRPRVGRTRPTSRLFPYPTSPTKMTRPLKCTPPAIATNLRLPLGLLKGLKDTYLDPAARSGGYERATRSS